MINEGMEKKIADLSSKYIYNQTTGSLLLLLLSYIEEKMNKSAAEKSFDFPPEITDLKDKTTHYILKLAELLEDEKQKKAALEDCYEAKKKLLEIYKTVYCYFAQLNIVASVTGDEISIRKYKDDPDNKDKKVNFAMFYADCIEFLQSAEDEMQFKSYVGQLFKCLPLKMARDKYYDMVKKSLKSAFKYGTKQTIVESLKALKDSCTPQENKAYGKYFSDIAAFIEEKKSVKPSNLTDEQLDEEFEGITAVYDVLNDIEDYCQELLNDINSLIILFGMNFTFEEITEQEFGYSDIYHKICEIINSNDDNIFDDTIKTMLEDYIEPLIDASNDTSKKEMELLKKCGDFSQFSEETLTLLGGENYIRSLFYDDINEEIFNFEVDVELPEADEDFKEKEFNKFIDFIKGYFEKLPLHVRKSAMLVLLSSLPPDMTLEEITDCIQEGVDTAASFEHSLLIVDKAGDVFMDNGFISIDDNEDECGCGHDHHHDHDCGCGHEHHHH